MEEFGHPTLYKHKQFRITEKLTDDGKSLIPHTREFNALISMLHQHGTACALEWSGA